MRIENIIMYATALTRVSRALNAATSTGCYRFATSAAVINPLYLQTRSELKVKATAEVSVEQAPTVHLQLVGAEATLSPSLKKLSLCRCWQSAKFPYCD